MYVLNQIYNENSFLAIKKIKDRSIDCIYIDIPYLLQKGGGIVETFWKKIN